MSERIRKLRDEFPILGIDAALITDNLNVRYISGFTGSFAITLITRKSAFLLTDSRYIEQAAQECPGFSIERIEGSWIPYVQQLVKTIKPHRVGFEDNTLSYNEWNRLSAGLSAGQLVPVNDPIGRLRMVKDSDEIAAIREAARIADSAYEHIVRNIKPGLSERDIALEIDCFMRKNGADKEGFDTIVAFGTRSALPHAKPTDKRIAEGGLIVMDFGAVYAGYHSDITRTVVLGIADKRQEEIYSIVLEAQSRAISAIRPGLAGGDVDSIARDYIKDCGYGENFGHGLGHGLGLAIHDGKILAKGSDIILQPGMVVTVEPGIYIPGWGGIRIEDDVLVTDTGHELLTRSPKVLEIS